MLIIISIVLLTILTPFWYIFLIIYILLGIYLAWQLKNTNLKHHIEINKRLKFHHLKLQAFILILLMYFFFLLLYYFEIVRWFF